MHQICRRVLFERETGLRASKLTPESKLVLRFGPDHRRMNRTRVLIFASVVAAAMAFGGVLGATVLAHSTLTPANAAPLAAASPSPTFKSNEDATHEKAESAAQETAENNGTFHPGGPGGPGGQSNETATHEAGESAAREASEKT